MENSLPFPKAELYLENKANRIFYKKMLSPETSLAEMLEITGDLESSNFTWSDIQINIPDNEWLHTIYLYESHGTLTVSYLYPKPEVIFNAESDPFEKIVKDELSKEGIQDRIVRQFPWEIMERSNEIMAALDSEDLIVAWDGVVDADQHELLVNYYYDENWWLIFEHRILQTGKLETMNMEEIRNIAGKLSALTKEIVESIVSKISKR